MALRKQVISAAMGKGLDAGGSDPKLVGQGFLNADNVVFPRKGTVGKRVGTNNLRGTYSSVLAMAEHDDNPILIQADTNLAEFNGTSDTVGQTNAITDFSVVGTHALTFVDAIAETITYQNGDVLRASEVVVIGDDSEIVVATYYSTDNSLFYLGTFNRITGAVTFTSLAASVLGNGSRLVAPGNGSAYCIYSTSANALKAREVTFDGTIQAAVTITVSPSPSDTVAKIDACAFGDAGYHILIAYVDTSSDITVLSWNPVANTEVDTTITLTSVSALCCIPLPEGGNAYGAVAYVADSLLTMVVYDDALSNPHGAAASSASTPSDVKNIAGIGFSDGGVNVYFTSLAASSRCNVSTALCGASGGTTTVGAILVSHYNACMIGGPISYGTASGSDLYLASAQTLEPAAAWQEDPQKNIFVMRCTAPNVALSSKPVGRVLDGLGFDQLTGNLPVAHAFTDPLNSQAYLWPVSRWYTQGNVGETAGIDLVTVTKDSTVIPVTTKTDSSLLITNSVPYEYDGYLANEQGFLMYPDAPVIAEHADAGSWGATSGSVGFKIVYEWTDSKGNRQQSAPSAATSWTLTADKKLEVTAQCLNWGYRGDIRIVVYRTVLNGAAYHRDKVLENNTSQQTVTASGTDLVTGAPTATDTVTANEPLYADGNQIENIAPHAHRVACSYQNRYFYADRQHEELIVRYSQEYQTEAGLGLRQNDVMQFKIDPEGGRITALAVNSEKLFIFKQSRIYATHGQGLDPQVVQGITYERPRLVNPTIGCIEQRSVGKIPQGLVFQGQDGIYLLTPGEDVQFIGHEVRYYTDTYAIKNCTVIPEKHYVIWGTGGPALVYDYLYEQWSTFVGAYDGMLVATEARGLTYFISDSTARVEDRSGYIDQNTGYYLDVTTGWFNLTDLLSFKRLYRALLLLQNLTSHKLRIRTGYDFDPTWVDDQVFDPKDLKPFAHTNYFGAGLGSSYNDQAYMLELYGSRQKLTSVRFRITDENPVGEISRQALEITALAFEIGVREGLHRLGVDRGV